MLTKYEEELIEYWKNWKPGMGPYKGIDTKEEKVKHTKKFENEKKPSREIMEEMQFELGLTEDELDDLLIPEEEWNDLDEQ